MLPLLLALAAHAGGHFEPPVVGPPSTVIQAKGGKGGKGGKQKGKGKAKGKKDEPHWDTGWWVKPRAGVDLVEVGQRDQRLDHAGALSRQIQVDGRQRGV